MGIPTFFPVPEELLKSQGNYFSTFQKHSAYPPKKLLVYLYPTEPNAPKNTYLKYVTVTHQRMKSPQVHHKVTVKTKRFRVQWFGQKISMLFFRRYMYNLEFPISDTNEPPTCWRNIRTTVLLTRSTCYSCDPTLLILTPRWTPSNAFDGRSQPWFRAHSHYPALLGRNSSPT